MRLDAQRWQLAASVTMKSSTIVFSCPNTADRQKMIEKVLRSGKLSEVVVFLERDIKDRAETTSMETVRLRHVIIGILPYV